MIGYDDVPEAAIYDIATVRVPRREIGRAAVELLERAQRDRLTGQVVTIYL